MRNRSSPSWLRPLTLTTLLLAGSGAVATSVREDLGEVWGAPLLLLGYLVVGGLFLRGARFYNGKERLAWRLIGAASLLGAAGLLAFAAAAALGFEIGAFGPLDIFFLGAYLTNVVALWVLPHLQGGPIRRTRIFLDGLVGAVSVGVVTWVWFLGGILEEVRQAPPWEVVVGTTYPLVDVGTIVVVMVVTLRRSSLRFDPRILLLGLGFVGQAIADLVYLNRGLGESFSTTAPFYPLLLAAVSCFLGAGLLLGNRPAPREYAERRTPWWAMIAPYGAAVVLVGMLINRMVDTSPDVETVELLVGSVIVVALIILRQTLAIRETRELVERQRSALVSSISHELRTPLTAMVGFLDIMADPDQRIDPEARQEMAGIVSQQANYMARIVSDLIMLNRAEPDLGLAEREVEMEPLVTSAVASLDIDSGSGVAVDVERNLTGRFDPTRIHQVLVNLLTNAARYGGPNKLVVAKRSGSDLVLEVHDDGPGVPKRYELVIWDRFERGAHRYNAGVPGSGIGLALVGMLVRGHNGSVGYRRSERLGGACFVVTLPGRAREAASVGAGLQSVGRTDP